MTRQLFQKKDGVKFPIKTEVALVDQLLDIKNSSKCIPDRIVAYAHFGIQNISKQLFDDCWVCEKHGNAKHAEKLVNDNTLNFQNFQERTFFLKRMKYMNALFEKGLGHERYFCSCGSLPKLIKVKANIVKPFVDMFAENGDFFDSPEDMKAVANKLDSMIRNARLIYAAHGKVGSGKDGLGGSANPRAIAASILYIFAVKYGLDLTQKDVAACMGVSTTVIRYGYAGIRDEGLIYD